MPFEEPITYPCAVTDGPEDRDAIKRAYAWARDYKQTGERILVWSSRKDSVRSNDLAASLVKQPDTIHMTPRERSGSWAGGPAIALWANASDLSEIPTRQVTALVIVGWSKRGLEPWVRAVQPERLGPCALWSDIEPGNEDLDLDPGAMEAIKRASGLVNHSSTVKSGYNKSYIVQALLALRDAGHQLDPPMMQAWAIREGWQFRNATELRDLCVKIDAGTRPRVDPNDRLRSFTVAAPTTRKPVS